MWQRHGTKEALWVMPFGWSLPLWKAAALVSLCLTFPGRQAGLCLGSCWSLQVGPRSTLFPICSPRPCMDTTHFLGCSLPHAPGQYFRIQSGTTKAIAVKTTRSITVTCRIPGSDRLCMYQGDSNPGTVKVIIPWTEHLVVPGPWLSIQCESFVSLPLREALRPPSCRPLRPVPPTASALSTPAFHQIP